MAVTVKKRLIDKYSRIEQKEVRWHVAPMLVRLPLTHREEKRVLDLLLSYTGDSSSIVKTMAMQAMFELCLHNRELQPVVTRHIKTLTETGTAAMKARGRALLARLAKQL